MAQNRQPKNKPTHNMGSQFTIKKAQIQSRKRPVSSKTVLGKLDEVSKVAQLCPALCDRMDYSLPGSSHGIFQARVLEWVAISFSRENWIATGKRIKLDHYLTSYTKISSTEIFI